MDADAKKTALHMIPYGLYVQTANGASVSPLVRASAYECGILDLGLPDMDGIDLLRQLRAEGYSFPVPVGEKNRPLQA
jgi:DNA-binding response OmpR family regulator